MGALWRSHGAAALKGGGPDGAPVPHGVSQAHLARATARRSGPVGGDEASPWGGERAVIKTPMPPSGDLGHAGGSGSLARYPWTGEPADAPTSLHSMPIPPWV